MRKKDQEDILVGSSECHTACLQFLMCGRVSCKFLGTVMPGSCRRPRSSFSSAVHQLGNSPPTPDSIHHQSHNITPQNVTAVLCPSIFYVSETAWPLKGYINSCDMCWGPMAADHEQHDQVSLPNRLRAFKYFEVCSATTDRTQSLPVTV